MCVCVYVLFFVSEGLRHIRRPPLRATRACNLGGAARTSIFAALAGVKCVKEARMTSLVAGSRVQTLLESSLDLRRYPHRGQKRTWSPVSRMSTSQGLWGGPREHVICEGSGAHPICAAALACVKSVEEARMTTLVGR